MAKYIYHCLASDTNEIDIESDEALFIDELIEEAGRDDLMIMNMTIEE